MIQRLNEQLMGYNVAKQLKIEINPFTLHYNLTMVLADSEALFAK